MPSGKSGRRGRSVKRAGQHGLGGRLAFAAEEAAGNAARGVHLLFKVDAEGEEVQPFAHVLRHGGRRQQHRVADLQGDGAAGLLGQLAGLDGQLHVGPPWL
jgi:hypothetical protein